jgi:uncharacterized protein YukE
MTYPLTFSVDLADLPGLTRLVLRTRADMTSCAQYLRRHQDAPWSAGLASGALISVVKPVHDDVVVAVDAQLRQRLGAHAGNLAQALDSVTEYYADTDTRAAAKADALRPAASHSEELAGRYDPLDPPVPLFTDVVRPTGALVPPSDHRAEFQQDPVDWLRDPVSFSRVLRDLVWQLTSLGAKLGWCDRPVDIFAELVQPVLGNWPGMLVLSDVFTNIGTACAMVNQNLAENEINVRMVWQGHAADACQEHLKRFGLAHVATQQWLAQIADCYRRIGVSVCELVQKLGDLLGRLTDMALTAMLAAEAAEATLPTVIGPTIFTSAAMYKFYQFWQALQAGKELAEATDLVVDGYLRQLRRLISLDEAPRTPPTLRLPEPAR